MRKKYIQNLRNERLKGIRTNLRRLLIQSVANEQSKYSDALSELDVENPADDQKYRENHEKWWELERLIRKSICQCPVCKRSDKNMTYNPYYDTWFCNDCYLLNQKYYRKEGKFEWYP
ncbi:MAG: hypothetical protein P8Y70_13195 [Candidatus Lokiarchaeota archaeon]